MHPQLIALNLDFTARYVKGLQRPDGAILWNANDKLDPWDHVEAAMGLSVAGYWQAAEDAYAWLADNQLADGSWQAAYFTKTPSELKETNFIAYVATGIWHHFLISRDHTFLERFFPVAERALNFILRFQTEHGDIAWAINRQNQPEPDALLTACSSILRSIECGIRCATTLGLEKPRWHSAWQQLKHCIQYSPERFDRTWESKARYAMDWYYPILAGIYTETEAQQRIQSRWSEFVESPLGCRCVSDEPWVTMAETSELVMALLAANMRTEAQQLFDTLAQWQQPDGGYVTGYVFRDNVVWPEDKTSWTAGAVLLAADALLELTQGSTLFTQPANVA